VEHQPRAYLENYQIINSKSFIKLVPGRDWTVFVGGRSRNPSRDRLPCRRDRLPRRRDEERGRGSRDQPKKRFQSAQEI
jgi:hypothetical protein